ncbi:tyrosine-type recombinase/integrase [Pseudomonas brenneri]
MASISKDKGRWRVQIRKSGFSLSENFDSKREAENWAKAKEDEIKAAVKGSLRDPFKGMEVQDLITAYVEKVGPVKGWARSKDYVLERLKNDPMIGKIRVSAFSRLHVSQFVTERMKTAQGSTIAGDLDFLAGVFKWARDVRLLNVNPELIYAERRSLPHRGLKTKSNKRDRVATRDELQRIARYFDENLRIRLPMTSIVHFASISTLRQDEICKLQIEDVNFTKLEMLVRDRKDPEEKLNNNSLVPILKPMYGILKKAIGNRSSGPVFTWTLKKTGEIKETYADSVRANFERACVALGIVGLRFHDLRHTAITNLFAIGLQIQEVSLFSGHKDWTNLKRYTHVSPGDVQRSIARLQFLEEQSRTSKREKSNGINEVSSVFFNRFDSACGESSWAWFGAGLIADSISNAGHELLQ